MATVRRENGDLTPEEKKEVQAVFDHACTWHEKLKNLAEEFDKKGSFGLMWDSKVPKKDKWFFYFFTFRSSNKDDVNAEIQKYMEFYRQMSEAANQMMNNSEGTSQRDRDVCQLVKELREHLTKLSGAAETGEETTGSSTVYRLHREFIDKHEKLEHLIKKVECVALRQSREMAMEQSQKMVEEMKTAVKQSEERVESLCGKVHELLTKYEDVTEEKNEIAEQKRQLLEERNDLKEQKRMLLEERNDLKEQLAKSDDMHKDVCEKFNQLFAKFEEVRNDSGVQEELDTLRREKLELEERNRRLEQERREQSRAIQELSRSQEEMFQKNEMVWNMLKKMQSERGGI